MRVPKIGEEVRIKNDPALAGIPLFVKKVEWHEITLRKKYGRDDIVVLDDDIEFVLPETLEYKELKEIVLRLVTIPLKRIERVIFINQEVTVLKSLIVQYPALDFWRIFYPGFQVKSLNYFLNAGEVLLKKEYHLFLCPVKERQEAKVSSQKIGEDAVVKPKQNLREWLK